jgi:uncharacterized protein
LLYFDTSFLTPLVRMETTSEQVAAFMSRLPAHDWAVSHWTRVEFSSLIARDVRMRGLDARAAVQADAEFEMILNTSFAIVPLDVDDFEVAKRYLGRYETGLRAGDALHLAVAANHRATAIYSLDKAMLKAGQILHLPVSTGIRVR